MNENMKEFLETHAWLLKTNRWDEFLYAAYMYLDNTDELFKILKVSDIEYESHIQSALEYLMLKSDTLRSTKRVKADIWRRIYPTYSLSSTEWDKTFIAALKNVYPSKVVELAELD